MYPLWLQFLERVGTPLSGQTSSPILPLPTHRELTWRDAQRHDVLFQLYGPIAGGPWEPYQCPTLFAALDRLALTLVEVEPAPGYRTHRPAGCWSWLEGDAIVLLDLPGATVIEVGAMLVREVGVQLISTFDHWFMAENARRMTQVSEMVDPRPLLHMMASLAPDVHTHRQAVGPTAPAVWLCDHRRLGNPLLRPEPNTFDNRYFIDDSILPGIPLLKRAGIGRVVYFHMQETVEAGGTPSRVRPSADLGPFLREAHAAGMRLEEVFLMDQETWVTPRPMAPPVVQDFPLKNYSRTDLGGFGKLIPMPSEGGSHGYGGYGG